MISITFPLHVFVQFLRTRGFFGADWRGRVEEDTLAECAEDDRVVAAECGVVDGGRGDQVAAVGDLQVLAVFVAGFVMDDITGSCEVEPISAVCDVFNTDCESRGIEICEFRR